MRFLVDTNVLLWAAADSPRLSDAAAGLLANPANELTFSTISVWEIAIKRKLGRSDFHVEPRSLRQGLISNGYAELAMNGEHALTTELLPMMHKDPFDRLLLAQAMVEGMTLMTADKVLASYPGPILRV